MVVANLVPVFRSSHPRAGKLAPCLVWCAFEDLGFGYLRWIMTIDSRLGFGKLSKV